MNLEKVEYYYWTFFNVFARKVLGFGFLIGGLIMFLVNLPILFNPDSTININRVPTNSLAIKLMTVGLGLVVGVLGFLLTRVSKYYPPRIKKWIDQSQMEKKDLAES